MQTHFQGTTVEECRPIPNSIVSTQYFPGQPWPPAQYPCLSCGRCPTCGRGGYSPYPPPIWLYDPVTGPQWIYTQTTN